MTSTRPIDTPGATDADTVLRRIRALLDQAENTPFPSEAETFAAKAAELMARHRVDQAVLDRHRPTGRAGIVEIDVELGRGQYVRARLALLGAVAEAFDCRLLTSTGPDGRTGHVIGQADDTERVALLYTSLLVQATRAADAERTPHGQARVAFRRGFLLGFAERVGGRLAERMAAEVARAEPPDDPTASHQGTSAALVLAERRDRVSEWIAEHYPRLGHLGRAAPVPAAAVSRGAAAGDRADLGDRRVRGPRGQLGR